MSPGLAALLTALRRPAAHAAFLLGLSMALWPPHVRRGRQSAVRTLGLRVRSFRASTTTSGCSSHRPDMAHSSPRWAAGAMGAWRRTHGTAPAFTGLPVTHCREQGRITPRHSRAAFTSTDSPSRATRRSHEYAHSCQASLGCIRSNGSWSRRCMWRWCIVIAGSLGIVPTRSSNRQTKPTSSMRAAVDEPPPAPNRTARLADTTVS